MNPPLQQDPPVIDQPPWAWPGPPHDRTPLAWTPPGQDPPGLDNHPWDWTPPPPGPGPLPGLGHPPWPVPPPGPELDPSCIHPNFPPKSVPSLSLSSPPTSQDRHW